MIGPAPHIATPHPGPRSAAIIERLRKSEGQPGLTHGLSAEPPVLARAEGAVIEDPDGNRFLDMVAGFGSLNLGHSHPAIVDAARRQMAEGQQAMSMASPVRTELIERLSRQIPGLTRVVLGASGSEAAETALKLARRATGKPGALAFAGGFHGRTLGALGLMGRGDQRTGLGPLGSVTHLPFPHALHSAFGSDPKTVAERTLDLIDIQLGDPSGGWDQIGAVVIEPVQGNGGMVPVPPGFLTGLREVCSRHDVLLVIDEVMSGFHRTGRPFALLHDDVDPDLVIIGKSMSAGLPLSGVLASEAVVSASAPGTETSTYAGNLVSCAAALAADDVYRTENMSGVAEALGKFLLERLREELEDEPRVAEIRGLGLMVGVELAGPDGSPLVVAKQVSEECVRRGLLVYPGGHYGNVVGMLPPLVAAEEELGTAVGILGEALRSIG
ncbi:MAG: aspartate aminotransferase family protein [Acidimicrobiia bacterium]